MSGKSARFDHGFLVEQLDKRKKWKSQGKRAGNGNEFNIHAPLAELNRMSSALQAAPIPPAPIATALIDTTGLPDWLVDILNTDDEVARCVADKKAEIESPFKRRLAYGIKDKKEFNRTDLAEHWLQVRLFYVLERDFPDFFPYVYSVPNGGHRTKRTAMLMNAEGLMGGVQDIAVSYPRGIYHGMFLEVKTDKGSASKVQKEVKERFSNVGYHCVIEKGFDACLAALKAYFALPNFDGISIIKESA